jgi:hypothetical protein
MTAPLPPDPPRTSKAVQIFEGFSIWKLLKVLFGLPMVAFGGWMIYKDVAPDGHVELTTASVGLVIAVLGAFLVDGPAIKEFGEFAKGIVPTIRGK